MKSYVTNAGRKNYLLTVKLISRAEGQGCNYLSEKWIKSGRSVQFSHFSIDRISHFSTWDNSAQLLQEDILHEYYYKTRIPLIFEIISLMEISSCDL